MQPVQGTCDFCNCQGDMVDFRHGKLYCNSCWTDSLPFDPEQEERISPEEWEIILTKASF